LSSYYEMIILPSLLWHCWLGIKKSIQPIKIEWWGASLVICLERKVQMICIWSSWCHCHPLFLASLMSRILPYPHCSGKEAVKGCSYEMITSDSLHVAVVWLCRTGWQMTVHTCGLSVLSMKLNSVIGLSNVHMNCRGAALLYDILCFSTKLAMISFMRDILGE